MISRGEQITECYDQLNILHPPTHWLEALDITVLTHDSKEGSTEVNI